MKSMKKILKFLLTPILYSIIALTNMIRNLIFTDYHIIIEVAEKFKAVRLANGKSVKVSCQMAMPFWFNRGNLMTYTLKQFQEGGDGILGSQYEHFGDDPQLTFYISKVEKIC